MESASLRDALVAAPESMGSASLRINHSDAIASVKMANRKLLGFEQV